MSKRGGVTQDGGLPNGNPKALGGDRVTGFVKGDYCHIRPGHPVTHTATQVDAWIDDRRVRAVERDHAASNTARNLADTADTETSGHGVGVSPARCSSASSLA